jgi:hypothetical protein
MPKILYTDELSLNARNLGLEVNSEVVRVPEALRGALESMGVRTADTLVAALQSFPTVLATQTGLDPASTAKASEGALELLRPYVDPTFFQSGGFGQRRGLGALPPRWAKMSGER